MDEERAERLGRVFAEVLEKQSFMFAEPAEKAAMPAAVREYVLASMTFSGHWRGSLELAVPIPMCSELAANVLGLEDDDEMATARGPDALKELLNVTCGSILTTLAGDQPVFDLSVPEVVGMFPERWKDLLQSSDTLAFTVEDVPILLRLWLGRTS
ncbi:MAG TPA: chemotaxis protein CheX [Planctomycetota bacterium]|nr:chemotaxis protein CheX [Planctomycetota bacterium]